MGSKSIAFLVCLEIRMERRRHPVIFWEPGLQSKLSHLSAQISGFKARLVILFGAHWIMWVLSRKQKDCNRNNWGVGQRIERKL